MSYQQPDSNVRDEVWTGGGMFPLTANDECSCQLGVGSED